MPKKSALRPAPTPAAQPAPPAGELQFWLMKSEADCFSFEDLQRAPRQTTCWDGIRNFEARNTLRDRVREGDLVLYYHSNAEPSGVAGIARCAREGYIDHTAFDANHEHFDLKSDPEKPTWYMIDLQAVVALPRFVEIGELRADPLLREMEMFRRNRLSVVSVRPEEFRRVCALGGLEDMPF